MDLQREQNTQANTCHNCQDENNNDFRNCERQSENEALIILSDIDSDDEYISAIIDNAELRTLNAKKLWHDVSHVIKCVYRETNNEFIENHSINERNKTKKYVKILTKLDSESLFNKISSIVIEYVNEIRCDVLQRSQTYLKTSNDVQLFISYLLDEYQTFIQAAKNVSIIVSYLEEHYMKHFKLTWLLFNKHLYEKFVYMDKKIQELMLSMIDFIQPAINEANDYSSAEYAQLMNRFLAFDEEMSEISCFYKDCENLMSLVSESSTINKQNQMGIIVRKTKRRSMKIDLSQNMSNSSTLMSSNTLSSDNPSNTIEESQDDSLINLNVDMKECVSISSNCRKVPSDYLDTNNLHEEILHDLVNNVISINEIESNRQAQILNTNERKEIENASSTKKSKSHKSSSNRRKENSKTSIKPDFILPPKPPTLSANSKLNADLRPLGIPLLNKTELPAHSLLSAKIQSVSFTPGTFASITTNETSNLNPNQSKRLNLNLSTRSNSMSKSDLVKASDHLDQLLRQATVTNELSSLLTSLETTTKLDDLQKSSINNKTCDLCSCDSYSESNSSTSNGCASCMSMPNSTIFPSNIFTHDIKQNGRIKLRLGKRSCANVSEQLKPSINIDHSDDNIDDLVRYIDGDDAASNEKSSKNSKKKKHKQNQRNVSNDEKNKTKLNVENSSSSKKRKQQTKVENEQEEDKHSTPSRPLSPTVTTISNQSDKDQVEETKSMSQTKLDSNVESINSPEEEISWITISRKQAKHKTNPTSAVSTSTASNDLKQKRQPVTNKSQLIQQNLIANSKIRSHIVTKPPTPVVSSPTKSKSEVKKVERASPWIKQAEQNPEPSILIPSTNNAFNQLTFVDTSSHIFNNQDNYFIPPMNSTFSPAPGSSHTTKSRCIQRPSSEPRDVPFPTYSPMNYTIDNATTSWNASQWNFNSNGQQQNSQIPDDFPIYDPFNSGAVLSLAPMSLISDRFQDNLCISQNNDMDEMDAFAKEIEYLKKHYIDSNDQFQN